MRQRAWHVLAPGPAAVFRVTGSHSYVRTKSQMEECKARAPRTSDAAACLQDAGTADPQDESNPAGPKGLAEALTSMD